MLKIRCPNGALEYPKSVLQSSPFIKNSLLETHFFGQFSQANEIFVQYSFDSLEKLIPFIREGILIKKDRYFLTGDSYNLFRYLSMENPDSYFYIVCMMVKQGLMDITGYHIKAEDMKEIDLKKYPYISYYDKEAAYQRNILAHNVILNFVKNYFVSDQIVQINDVVHIYDHGDDQIGFSINFTTYDRNKREYVEHMFSLNQLLTYLKENNIQEKAKEIRSLAYNELITHY